MSRSIVPKDYAALLAVVKTRVRAANCGALRVVNKELVRLVLACPGCGSRMRILAAIEDPAVARKILDSLGLPSRSSPVAPARRNPHPTLTEFVRTFINHAYS